MELSTPMLARDIKAAIQSLYSRMESRCNEIKESIEADRETCSDEPSERHYQGGSGYWYMEDGPSEFDIAVEPKLDMIRRINRMRPRIQRIEAMVAFHSDDTMLILSKSDHDLIVSGPFQWEVNEA